MLPGRIGDLGDIVDEVVKLGPLELALLVRDRSAAVSAGSSTQSAVGMRQLQLPTAITADHRLKLIGLIIEPIGGVRVLYAAFA